MRFRFIPVEAPPIPAGANTQEPDMGKLTENIKGTANELAGRTKQHSNDPETRADGVKQEVKGKAQKVKGDVEGAVGNKI